MQRKQLDHSDDISQQLNMIKNEIIQNVDIGCDSSTNIADSIHRINQLRRSFALLADLLEDSQALNQTLKERKSKRNIFLQGLTHHKEILKQQLSEERQMQITSLAEYVDKNVDVDDWARPNFEQVITGINEEIEKRKKLKSLEEYVRKRQLIFQSNLKNSKELYQELGPKKARPLITEMKKFCRFFNFDQSKLGKAQGANEDLRDLHSSLKSLQSQLNITVDLQRNGCELKITINNHNSLLYRLAKSYQINLSQQETTIYIASPSISPRLSKLIIGIEESSPYPSYNVFHRLFQGQTCRPLFDGYTINQFENNLNQKYVLLNWVSQKLLTGMINGEMFIGQIQIRIFSLKLMEYLVNNMNKLERIYLPLNQIHEELAEQMKLTYSGYLQKHPKQSYLRMPHQPDWIEEYLMRLNEQNEPQQQSNPKFEYTCHFLKRVHLEQYVRPFAYHYYRGRVDILHRRIEFMLIVPFIYPHEPSIFKILNYKELNANQKQPLNGIPCKFKVKADEVYLPEEAFSLERMLNAEALQFESVEGKEFQLLSQMGKLIQFQLKSAVQKSDIIR